MKTRRDLIEEYAERMANEPYEVVHADVSQLLDDYDNLSES